MIKEIRSVSQFLKYMGENLRPDSNYDIQVGDLVKFKTPEEVELLSSVSYGEVLYDDSTYSYLLQIYEDRNFNKPLKTEEGTDVFLFLSQVGVKNLIKIDF